MFPLLTCFIPTSENIREDKLSNTNTNGYFLMLLFSSIGPLLFSILAELFSSLEVGAVYRVLSSKGAAEM